MAMVAARSAIFTGSGNPLLCLNVKKVQRYSMIVTMIGPIRSFFVSNWIESTKPIIFINQTEIAGKKNVEKPRINHKCLFPPKVS